MMRPGSLFSVCFVGHEPTGISIGFRKLFLLMEKLFFIPLHRRRSAPP